MNASFDGREGGTEGQSATEVAQRTEQDREVVSHGCSAFWVRSSHCFLPKMQSAFSVPLQLYPVI